MAHHLTLEEREVIAQMRSAGRNQAETARGLGRAESTISRELQRNRSRNGYWAVAAQGKAQTRRSRRPRVCRLQRPEVRRYVQQRLRQCWSPDEIAWRSRDDRLWSIAAAAWATGKETRWWARAVAGGPSRWSSGNRATSCWAGSPTSAPQRSANPRRSCIAPYRLPCGRRSPWTTARSSPNTNGLIRQFFPKGTDLARVPKHRFTKVQDLLNNRPRKRLRYRTPLEVLGPRLHLAIAS